jgi:hypothetical protein
MFLLVCAVTLSLAAQLAVAKPGPSGWLLSAVPALAFMGLSKLVLSGKAPAGPTPAIRPAQSAVEATAQPTRTEVVRRSEALPATATRQRRAVSATGRKRRPAAETRRLAHEIMSTEPALSREQVAERLGLSSRRLRTVLATADI